MNRVLSLLQVVWILILSLAIGTSSSFGVENQGLKQAHLFAGTNAGMKIANCIKALPESGGICDARGLFGDQIIDVDIFGGITKDLTLLLGHTTYLVSVPQLYKPNRPRASIKIVGQGLGTILRSKSNMNILSIDMRNAEGKLSIYQYVYLTDLAFDLNKTDSTAVELVAAGQKTVLSRLFVENNNDHAKNPLIRVGRGPIISSFETAHSTTLRDLRLHGNSKEAHGIEVNSTITTVDALDCTRVYACVSVGIQSVSGLTVMNSRLDASRHALLVNAKATQGLTYASNRAEDNSEEHIKIVGLAAKPITSKTQSVTIRDSYFTGMKKKNQDGIYLSNIDEIIVEGNIFKAPESGSEGGVSAVVFGPNVENVFLAGNGVRLGISTEMPGFETVPLSVNDVTVTQGSKHAL